MKTKFRILIFSLIVVVIASLVSAIVIILRYEQKEASRVALLSVVSVVLIMSVVIVLSIWSVSKKQRVEIKKSFEQYMEELFSSVGVGTIMFNNEGVIIWTSKFISDIFNNSLIGKNITEISFSFTEELYANKTEFVFEVSNMFYEAKVVRYSNSIIIKDVSEKNRIKQQYINERTVVGEIDIDNFQEYISILPEEEVFSIQSSIIKVLDKLVEKYNIIYRQYVNGKFLVITDSETLNSMEKNRFSELTNLKTNIKVDNIKLTVSVGFGIGSTIPSELMQLAKDSVFQSQSRGGNQVTICSLQDGYKRYGAKTESFSSTSRVTISKISKLFFLTLKKPEIKTVLIYGHKMADLDALGSTYAIYERAIESGKKAYIVGSTFDSSTKKAIAKFIPNKSEVFVKPHNIAKFAKKSTMVVICDVTDPSRTENSFALAGIPPKNIFIFDHHRISELPPTVLKGHTYIDPAVSSASEIVSELIQYSNKNIKPSKTAVQLLLSGIYLDTKIFQKQVSARTFASAAWLESFGAKPIEAADLLKFSEEQSKIIREILSQVQEVKPGYFLAAYDGEAGSDVIAKAADEILRTQGRIAAFVIAKIPGEKIYKMSTRSINVNVQIIAEEVGGGGHFSAAAAVSDEPLVIFKENVIQSIVGKKHESNNN